MNTTPTPASAEKFAFLPGFLWGAATSAYQIEGAADEDGRGPSVWDAFCKQPGRVADGASGRVACDHYHRYREDVALMRRIGLRAYRFSISWSRLLPEGHGRRNAAGFEFYDRLIDELLANGIEPWITLFHWDTPEALEREFGGWTNREIVSRFSEYAWIVGSHFGDRVKRFFTTNEFGNFTDRAYFSGGFAPGKQLDRKTRNQTRHHAILAHGAAVQALRAAAPDARVGIAEDPTPMIPIFETPEHIDAARKAYRLENAHFLTAILEGAYPEEYLAAEGADAPEVRPGDFDTIASPMDFVAFNAYTGQYVRSSSRGNGYEIVPKNASHPYMDLDWLRFAPETLYWSCRFQRELWGVKELYVSENGCSTHDAPTAAGEVLDTDRVMYLRAYLRSAQRAVAEGYPLKGYFQWSLLDNFEWASGYGPRFGLVRVDYETQARTPKLSAEYYSAVIRENRVV